VQALTLLVLGLNYSVREQYVTDILPSGGTT